MTPGPSTITINGVGPYANLTAQEYSTGFTTTAFTVGQWQGTTGHNTQRSTVSLQPQTSPNELCVGMLSSGRTETFSPTTSSSTTVQTSPRSRDQLRRVLGEHPRTRG